MKKLITLFAVLAMASVAVAEETTSVSIEALKATSAAKTECSNECASECTAGCPIESAMAKLPQLQYVVGDESTTCAVTAGRLATKHKTKAKFVVAKKEYETEDKAYVALVAATESFVADFTKTKECKVSGKYTVAGKELCCNVMASQRAELAKTAMKKVQMAYLVGDKECHCPTEAATLAKSTGSKKQFVVCGEKTGCGTTARLKLARAKYKAAVEALAKADAPKTAETEKS